MVAGREIRFMRVNLRVYIKRDVYRKRWVPGGIATAVTEDTLISESKYSFVRVCIGIVDRILLKRTLAADTAATFW